MAAPESDLIQKILSAGIPALITGLFGLQPVIIQRFSERRKVRSMQHKISKFANELDLLKQWVNLYRGDNGKPEKKQKSLGKFYNRILIEY